MVHELREAADKAADAAEGYLNKTPDWMKFVILVVAYMAIDRWGNLAHNVDSIQKDVAIMASSMISMQTTLDNHERRINELEQNGEISAKTARSLLDMHNAIEARLDAMQKVAR